MADLMASSVLCTHVLPINSTHVVCFPEKSDIGGPGHRQLLRGPYSPLSPPLLIAAQTKLVDYRTGPQKRNAERIFRNAQRKERPSAR
jgi:hypothetical protein